MLPEKDDAFTVPEPDPVTNVRLRPGPKRPWSRVSSRTPWRSFDRLPEKLDRSNRAFGLLVFAAIALDMAAAATF